MPSPRTEPDRPTPRLGPLRPARPGALFQRLNARLILALAVVALIGLLVSGLADQPDPARLLRRADASSGSRLGAGLTAILLLRTIIAELRTARAVDRRDPRRGPIVPRVAADAAARSSTPPSRSSNAAGSSGRASRPAGRRCELEGQGLRRDPTSRRVRGAEVDRRSPEPAPPATRSSSASPYSIARGDAGPDPARDRRRRAPGARRLAVHRHHRRAPDHGADRAPAPRRRSRGAGPARRACRPRPACIEVDELGRAVQRHGRPAGRHPPHARGGPGPAPRVRCRREP